MKFQNRKLLQARWVDTGAGKGEVFSLVLIFLRFFFFVERKSNVLFWFDLTEINMEVKAAGQRELCYERQT